MTMQDTNQTKGLSDKALAVFAFAAFHQLESGQRVTRVTRRDGAGHRADEEAVRELTERGLIEATDDAITFKPEAEQALQAAIEGMRERIG